MKRSFLIGLCALSFTANAAFGQHIPQSQVPSLVINSFQQEFPKTYDVEWENDGDMFKVEFETGLLRNDHDVWYDKTGKLIRHKEEFSKKELPQPVLEKIDSDFNGYRIDDVEKITEDGRVTYTLELKKAAEEWIVAVDKEGNILSKVAD